MQAREKSVQGLSSVYSSSMAGFGPWWGPVTESFTGAWQQNVTIAPTQTLLAFSAVYACVTGIASDIAKMRIKLNQELDGICEEVVDPHGNATEASTLALLKKPNRYQTRIKFIEQWVVSKLLYGNAYILKERSAGPGTPVTALYVLYPRFVYPLVAEDGGVYYQLHKDYLSGLDGEIIVPASEIIHDMMVSLWHPLVGVSPIYACSMSATMGNAIQNNSTQFNANLSRPGGMLTAPGAISNETADRLKTYFQTNFSGTNVGKLAVAGDGLKFEQFTMSAVDSQLIEQLQWTVQDVARAFRYPAYKLDASVTPKYDTLEAYTMGYYTDCLQTHIEQMEVCLDEGLGLKDGFETEFDIDNLVRMDTKGLVESLTASIKGTLMTPNEGRKRLNLKKVNGGDSVLSQQQNYSLEALAKRDAKSDPFAGPKPPTPVAPVPSPDNPTPKPPSVNEIGLHQMKLLKTKLRQKKAA